MVECFDLLRFRSMTRKLALSFTVVSTNIMPSEAISGASLRLFLLPSSITLHCRPLNFQHQKFPIQAQSPTTYHSTHLETCNDLFTHHTTPNTMQLTFIAVLALAATAFANDNKCSTCYHVGDKQCSNDGSLILQCSVRDLAVCWETAESCKNEGKKCESFTQHRKRTLLTSNCRHHQRRNALRVGRSERKEADVGMMVGGSRMGQSDTNECTT
jgi:hypothetical protein